MFRRGAVLLAVQDQVDPALAKQVDGFGTMPPGVMESQAAQGFAEPAAGFLIDSEFQELDAVETRWRRQNGAHRPRASTSSRERKPSRAISRAGAARNSSLKISSDSGPR